MRSAPHQHSKTRRALWVVAALLTCFLTLTAGAGAKAQPVVFLSPELGSKPREYYPNDYSKYSGLAWRNWGQKQAVANGWLLIKGRGTDQVLFDGPVRLVATGLKRCGSLPFCERAEAATRTKRLLPEAFSPVTTTSPGSPFL